MRLDCGEQVLRKFRKLVRQLELHPRAEKCDAFEQALDIGIGIVGCLEAKLLRGNFMLFAEFARAFAQVGQFIFVILEQARVHLLTPAR